MRLPYIDYLFYLHHLRDVERWWKERPIFIHSVQKNFFIKISHAFLAELKQKHLYTKILYIRLKNKLKNFLLTRKYTIILFNVKKRGKLSTCLFVINPFNSSIHLLCDIDWKLTFEIILYVLVHVWISFIYFVALIEYYIKSEIIFYVLVQILIERVFTYFLKNHNFSSPSENTFRGIHYSNSYFCSSSSFINGWYYECVYWFWILLIKSVN